MIEPLSAKLTQTRYLGLLIYRLPIFASCLTCSLRESNLHWMLVLFALYCLSGDAYWEYRALPLAMIPCCASNACYFELMKSKQLHLARSRS
jgi:hypothetical protein